MPFPQLKLAHKGILMVALPLAIQGGVYLKLKSDLAELQRETQELDIRRDVVNRVNQTMLYSFYGFQSLMQFKLYGQSSNRHYFEKYEENLIKGNDELADIIEKKEHDKERADRLRFLSRDYIVALKESQFNPDEHNQVATISDDLLRNIHFRDVAREMFTALKDLGLSEQAKVSDGSGREESYRKKVQQATDMTVLINAIVALLLAIVFVRGTVSKLNVLKENTRRFAADKPLLESLGTNDEIGELDAFFHTMAEALSTARTKEKFMNALLKDSKERLEGLINNIPAALVVTDERGRIQSLNPAADKLFGYKSEELSEKSIEKLFAKLPKGESLFEKLQSGTGSHPVALEALSSEQEIIAVEVATTHFEGPDGKSILATIIDVTERYKLEALKRDFYAMVSHDIRTPLTTISGVLQLSRLGRYGPVSEELASRLLMAEDNTHRLLEMVGKLLDLDKLEEGTIELKLETVPLQVVVSGAINATVAQREAKGITISGRDDGLVVTCDAHYLTQVLTNLVANAIRYSPQGGAIAIAAEEQEHYVLVSISDQGPGVPEAARADVFERFRQADAGRDQKSGFGLGLSICKSIISLHGGQIGVDSAPAGGARFWFKVAKG
ncbi:MAG: ATP-binding protein [Candidatus Obscuribacterales bacterium]|jgi:PAS domain S-box-containing protein